MSCSMRRCRPSLPIPSLGSLLVVGVAEVVVLVVSPLAKLASFGVLPKCHFGYKRVHQKKWGFWGFGFGFFFFFFFFFAECDKMLRTEKGLLRKNLALEETQDRAGLGLLLRSGQAQQ